MIDDLGPLEREKLKGKLSARATVRANRRRERHLNDIKETVKNPGGRRLLWSIIEKSGFLALSFVSGASDVSAHNEGYRALGKRVYDDLMVAAPEAIFQMQRESASEMAQDKAEDENLIQEASKDGD